LLADGNSSLFPQRASPTAASCSSAVVATQHLLQARGVNTCVHAREVPLTLTHRRRIPSGSIPPLYEAKGHLSFAACGKPAAGSESDTLAVNSLTPHPACSEKPCPPAKPHSDRSGWRWNRSRHLRSWPCRANARYETCWPPGAPPHKSPIPRPTSAAPPNHRFAILLHPSLHEERVVSSSEPSSE